VLEEFHSGPDRRTAPEVSRKKGRGEGKKQGKNKVSKGGTYLLVATAVSDER